MGIPIPTPIIGMLIAPIPPIPAASLTCGLFKITGLSGSIVGGALNLRRVVQDYGFIPSIIPHRMPSFQFECGSAVHFGACGGSVPVVGSIA